MVIFFDGGCLGGNSHGVAYGSASFDGKIVKYSFGEGSNNEAEYKTFLQVLSFLIVNRVESPTIYTDSALVVNQVLGKWKVKAPNLRRLHAQAQREFQTVKDAKLEWVPRDNIVAILGH